MAEQKEDLSYLDHDVDVLRELIRRGIESGPGREIDFEDVKRRARRLLAEELAKR